MGAVPVHVPFECVVDIGVQGTGAPTKGDLLTSNYLTCSSFKTANILAIERYLDLLTFPNSHV